MVAMRHHFTFAFVTAALLASTAATSAHFKLLAPPSWINSNELGDPQKAGPCGGDPKPGANDAILTKAVTKVTGGSMLPIKVQETIFHSGHYRVALSVNSRTELPPDPYAQEKWTERGLYSVWGQIQSPPQIPVLADGLFQHYNKPGEPASQRPKVPTGTVGNAGATAEHQLREVHSAGDSVHGGSRLQPARWLRLSPLRGSPDHRGSGQADRYPLAGADRSDEVALFFPRDP